LTPDEYFQEISRHIADFPFSYSFSIEFDKRSAQLAFVRGDIRFIDGSTLFFRKFIVFEPELRRLMYSYHFQSSEGALVFRYDNAPHFPNLPNFPHHKHDKSEDHVLPSDPPDLRTVLEEISDYFMRYFC